MNFHPTLLKWLRMSYVISSIILASIHACLIVFATLGKQFFLQSKRYFSRVYKDLWQKISLPIASKIMSKRRTTNATDIMQLFCSCERGREVELFCQDHEVVTCYQCSTIEHNKCNVYSLQEKRSSYRSSMLCNVSERLKNVKENVQARVKEHLNNRAKFVDQTDKCRTDVRAFRDEINRWVYEMVDEILEDVDKLEYKQLTCIDRSISSLNKQLQLVERDSKTLENVQKSGNSELMFDVDIRSSRNLQNYSHFPADISDDSEKPTLMFERNKLLTDMIKEKVMTLGRLCGNPLAQNRRSNKVLKDVEVSSTDSADVSHQSDNKTPWITGIAFLSEDEILVCDHLNDCIKRLDSSMVVKQTFKLSSYPYDIAVVDDYNVIISFPLPETLQFVQMFPEMKESSTIQLEKGCYGVEVHSGEIYTVCHNQPGDGEIQILGLDGTLKKVIEVKNSDGLNLLKSPYYLSVTSTGEIFVSDLDTNVITCVSAVGDIVRELKSEDLDGPLGIYVDAEQNVFVCSKRSKNINIITVDGNKSRTMLSSKDVLKCSHAIAYREKDSKFVVGCYDSNKLFFFHVS